MKRLSTVTISALLLAGSMAPAALASLDQGIHQAQIAQSIPDMEAGPAPSIEEVSPFELSYFTYYGGMEDYGIDGGIFLVQDFRSGDVTAEEVVQTAVDNNFVEEAALTDPLYVESVNDFLRMFETTDTSSL